MSLVLNKKFCFWGILFVVLFASFRIFAEGVTPTSPPAVTILSPPDQTIVVPGQTIEVNIGTTANINSAIIAVEKPLLMPKDTKNPKKFMLTIPPKLPEGSYRIKAMTEWNGEYLESSYVHLLVEWPSNPSSIVVAPASMTFDAIGKNTPLKVLGKFENDQVTNITFSPKTIYTSSNPPVATVSNDGVVSSLSDGVSEIEARSGSARAVIQVTVQAGKSFLKYDVRLEVHDFTFDKDGKLICNLTLSNFSAIPLSVLELSSVTLDDKNAVSLPPMKVGLGLNEAWDVAIPFADYVEHPGKKGVLHIEGVYSPTPKGFYDPMDFKFDADVTMP